MTTPAVARAAAPQIPPRLALGGVLAASGVSILGSRVTAIAIPWLVLVTTRSPTRMGLVAAAELVPLVLALALGGPLLDRVGVRRCAIGIDVASAVTVTAIIAFYDQGLAVLLVLVAVLGALRGFSDNAKKVLLPSAAAFAGAPMIRVTAIFEGMSRLSGLIGASVAGVLIAWLQAPTTMVVTAVAFAVSAVLVATMARPPEPPAPDAAPPERERYLQAMRTAVTHLRQDRICFAIMAMLFVINVFNQAAVVVFIPLWADEVLGSAVGVGAVLGAAGLGLVLGNLVFTIFATKVPRYATFTVGFLLGGPPRFLVLGLSDNLTVVLVVTFLAGCALSAVNPVIGLLLFERTPAALQARVFGLVTAIAWAGLPLGGLLAGWAVTASGLRPALLVTAAAYLAVALTPVIRHRTWRLINHAPESEIEPAAQTAESVDEPAAQTAESVDVTAS